MTIPTEVMMRMATIGLSETQARAVADMLTAVEAATEREAAQSVEASKAKARDRWHKWDEKRRSNVGKRSQTLANTSRQLAGTEDRTSNTVIEPQKKVSKEARAARLPENWTLPVEWRADALAAKLPEHLIDLEASKMRDWSQSAPKGAKTNWRPAWRNWCREAAARAGQQARAGPVVRLAPKDHFTNYANEISDGQIRDDRGLGGDWDDAPGVPLRTIQHHG